MNQLDEIRAADGTTAGIRGAALEVRDPRGRVLFEYDTTTGRAFFHLPEATLDVRSINGKIEIGSEQSIRIRSAESVEISAGDCVLVQAPKLDARLGRIDASAQEVRTAWGKLEQTVGRLFQWTKNAFFRVDELMHTRAGRVRTESRTSHVVQAESVRMTAREEVKVQGTQIHLG